MRQAERINSSLKELIENHEWDGFKFKNWVILDYGFTVFAIFSNSLGETMQLTLMEVFYDTDSDGNRTVYHGTIDNRKKILRDLKRKKVGNSN